MASSTFLPGIAEPLPPGETVRWQGGADPRAVARHVFHQRTAALYLGVLVALVGWRAGVALPAADAARVVLFPVLLAVLLLGVLEGMARATARHARFLITDRRIVMQVGAGFPVAINIPLRVVQSAGLRRFRDGTGEVRLELDPAARVAWSALWPFVSTFSLRNPAPRLRGLADPEAVSAALREAVARDAADAASAPVTFEAGPAPSADSTVPPLSVPVAP